MLPQGGVQLLELRGRGAGGGGGGGGEGAVVVVVVVVAVSAGVAGQVGRAGERSAAGEAGLELGVQQDPEGLLHGRRRGPLHFVLGGPLPECLVHLLVGRHPGLHLHGEARKGLVT